MNENIEKSGQSLGVIVDITIKINKIEAACAGIAIHSNPPVLSRGKD